MIEASRLLPMIGGRAYRVLEQHWAVVEPMSTKSDWVSYHYYVGLLKISEDKASLFVHLALTLTT